MGAHIQKQARKEEPTKRFKIIRIIRIIIIIIKGGCLDSRTPETPTTTFACLPACLPVPACSYLWQFPPGAQFAASLGSATLSGQPCALDTARRWFWCEINDSSRTLGEWTWVDLTSAITNKRSTDRATKDAGFGFVFKSDSTPTRIPFNLVNIHQNPTAQSFFVKGSLTSPAFSLLSPATTWSTVSFRVEFNTRQALVSSDVVRIAFPLGSISPKGSGGDNNNVNNVSLNGGARTCSYSSTTGVLACPVGQSVAASNKVTIECTDAPFRLARFAVTAAASVTITLVEADWTVAEPDVSVMDESVLATAFPAVAVSSNSGGAALTVTPSSTTAGASVGLTLRVALLQPLALGDLLGCELPPTMRFRGTVSSIPLSGSSTHPGVAADAALQFVNSQSSLSDATLGANPVPITASLTDTTAAPQSRWFYWLRLGTLPASLTLDTAFSPPSSLPVTLSFSIASNSPTWTLVNSEFAAPAQTGLECRLYDSGGRRPMQKMTGGTSPAVVAAEFAAASVNVALSNAWSFWAGATPFKSTSYAFTLEALSAAAGASYEPNRQPPCNLCNCACTKNHAGGVMGRGILCFRDCVSDSRLFSFSNFTIFIVCLKNNTLARELHAAFERPRTHLLVHGRLLPDLPREPRHRRRPRNLGAQRRGGGEQRHGRCMLRAQCGQRLRIALPRARVRARHDRGRRRRRS